MSPAPTECSAVTTSQRVRRLQNIPKLPFPLLENRSLPYEVVVRMKWVNSWKALRPVSSLGSLLAFNSHDRRIKLEVLATSLMVQWGKICLPMQETQVWSLIREDSTCHGATEAPAPQLLSLCSRAQVLQLLSWSTWKPTTHYKRSRHSEKPVHCNRVAPTHCS